jgi:mannitol/fructose-specific phosphotransferase system IIA component
MVSAIPHGVNEAKEQVVQTGVFIVQAPQGVVWNDKGDVARLIVGIAAKGKDHLSLLQRLTNVVMDEAVAERLATTTNKNDILRCAERKGADGTGTTAGRGFFSCRPGIRWLMPRACMPAPPA